MGCGNRASCKNHALEHEMRPVLEKQAIFEATGLVLTSIADDVFSIGLHLSGNAPLFADRISGASTTAKSGCSVFLKDVSRRELITPARAILLKRLAVCWLSIGKEDHKNSGYPLLGTGLLTNGFGRTNSRPW